MGEKGKSNINKGNIRKDETDASDLEEFAASVNEKGITVKKEDNFSDWYRQLIIKADLADYTRTSGCIVFKPTAWAIWEVIRDETDKRLKEIGVQNVNFPLFIPESLLKKEQEFMEGFTPEVAWVTEAGDSKLSERLAIRPTSESIIYDSYSRWVRSWRDLPIRYNQWVNVVRWEFSHPVPFFRTREFIFNEGHTLFATEEEALAEAKQIERIYSEVCEKFLALPGIYGRKTDKEKFAGGVFSEKLHYYIPGGRIIEGPAFHHDGQNFAKAYDIKFVNKNSQTEYGWQNTWAISTRMLGAMFAVHSDNRGLVLPPKVAPRKIVIIPIRADKDPAVLDEAKKMAHDLKRFGAFVDDRTEVTEGYKFNEWELKGIPLRIEIGPRDLAKKECIVVKRTSQDKSGKITLKIEDLKEEATRLLDEIQDELLNAAKKNLMDNMVSADTKDELAKDVAAFKMVRHTMCKDANCEEKLKEISGGAKVLFIDPKQSSLEHKNCIICGKSADYWVYSGKTY